MKFCDKFAKDGFQPGELGARVNALADEVGPAIAHFEEPKAGVGATDVPCDNHLSPFSQ
jgi:hypothetical protein